MFLILNNSNLLQIYGLVLNNARKSARKNVYLPANYENYYL